MTSEENAKFVTDEVFKIVTEVIERVADEDAYEHDKVTRWVANIVDQVLTELTILGKPFKYIVQVVSRCILFYNLIKLVF